MLGPPKFKSTTAPPLRFGLLSKRRVAEAATQSQVRSHLPRREIYASKGTAAITHFFHTDQSVVPTRVPAPSLPGATSPTVAALRSMISGVQRTPALPPRTSPSLRRALRLVR